MSLKKLALSVIALGLGACGNLVSPPKVAPASDPDTSLAKVLSQYVDPVGRVNFAAAAKDRGALDEFVSYVAVTDPASLPAGNERLAYLINSYNALALYGVLEAGIPSALDTDVKRANFFYLTEYVVGGKELSLYEYENEVIRKVGDPRIHFVVNCMSVGCPRLPSVPMRPSMLEMQLDGAATEFLNSPKYVAVDEGRKVVRLSEILKWYQEDFVKPGGASSILEYVNRYRMKPVPLDYAVEYIPYDWTINKQP